MFVLIVFCHVFNGFNPPLLTRLSSVEKFVGKNRPIELVLQDSVFLNPGPKRNTIFC